MSKIGDVTVTIIAGVASGWLAAGLWTLQTSLMIAGNQRGSRRLEMGLRRIFRFGGRSQIFEEAETLK